MEDHDLIVFEPKQGRRPVKIIFAAVFFVVAALFAYFFFAPAKSFAKSGAAIVISAWQSVFGAPQAEYFSSDVGSDDENGADSLAADENSSSSDGNSVAGAGENAAEGGTVKKVVAKSSDTGKSSPAKSVSVAAPAKNISETPIPALAAASASGAENISTISPVPSPAPQSAPPPSCAVSATANVSRKIIVNEIAWMGSPAVAGETGSAASNREWIELKNISSEAIGLANWQLLDLAGNIKIIFTATDTIAAGGFYLLERAEDDIAGATANKIYAGALANTGDLLALFDPTCAASEVVDASSGWPAGNNTTKQTLERDADGFGWHTSASPGGTPGAENSVVATVAATVNAPNAPVIIDPTPPAPALPSSPSSSLPILEASSTDDTSSTPTSTPAGNPSLTGHVVIAAVQIAGASSTDDFVKLYDPSVTAMDLSGWKLRKKSSTGTDSSLREFPAGSSVAPGGYFVWASSANGFGDGIGANVTSTGTLAADNSVALEDASGTIIDTVAWGTGTDQYGEGSAYPTNPVANQLLARKFSADGVIQDTDDNANDFTIQ